MAWPAYTLALLPALRSLGAGGRDWDEGPGPGSGPAGPLDRVSCSLVPACVFPLPAFGCSSKLFLSSPGQALEL